MSSLTEIRVDYENFKEFLWSHGWTQKSLATELGIDEIEENSKADLIAVLGG